VCEDKTRHYPNYMMRVAPHPTPHILRNLNSRSHTLNSEFIDANPSTPNPTPEPTGVRGQDAALPELHDANGVRLAQLARTLLRHPVQVRHPTLVVFFFTLVTSPIRSCAVN